MLHRFSDRDNGPLLCSEALPYFKGLFEDGLPRPRFAIRCAG